MSFFPFFYLIPYINYDNFPNKFNVNISIKHHIPHFALFLNLITLDAAKKRWIMIIFYYYHKFTQKIIIIYLFFGSIQTNQIQKFGLLMYILFKCILLHKYLIMKGQNQDVIISLDCNATKQKPNYKSKNSFYDNFKLNL